MYGTHVILNRGPALQPVTWDDATPKRAAQRAEALASLHNAKIERRPDGSWIVDATEYYSNPRWQERRPDGSWIGAFDE